MKSNTAQLSTLPRGSDSSRATRVVLFTDMVSYSHNIGTDEASTLEFMAGCFDTIRILSHRHNGTLVKTMGDGALLVFDDATNAISFGTEFHRTVAKIQAGEPAPYCFRTGLHAGEVVFRNGDVFGNTVNIAARLQAHAQAGGCVVSEQVYAEVSALPHLRFVPIGAPKLRNIQERIPLFQIVDPAMAATPAASGPLPTIALLNGPRIPEAAVPGDTAQQDRNALALLGYLALCSGHTETTERLITLLTPKLSQEKALTTLEASLSALAGFPGTADLRPTRQGDLVFLDQARFETDLAGHLRALRRGQVPAVFTQDADWPDRILAGFDGISPVFRTWLRISRENWRRRVLHALEELLERTPATERTREEAADAMLLLEPGNEQAALARIQARLFHDDRPAALAEYERLKRYLSQTHAIAPGKAIRDAIRAVTQNAAARIADQRPETRPRRLLRIAIGAIDPPPAETASIASAFRAELIASLTRFRDWSIIDMAMWSAGAGRDADIFDYVLDLGVPDTTGTLTVKLELRRHSSGRVVWVGHYRVAGNQAASLQEAIRDIILAIKGYVSSDRLAQACSGIDRFATSYDAWLRGDRALMRWTPEGAEEASTIFSAILDQDPDNAPALFRLASLVNIHHIIWPGQMPGDKRVRQAAKWAARAVDVDPMDGRIQRTVAWTAAMRREFARAAMHMDLAVGLNPNSQSTLASCAMGYAWFGQREKADATLTCLQGISRNMPDWCWAYNASTLYFLGRLDEAAEAAELGANSIIDNQGWIAAIQAERGDRNSARRAFETLFEDVRDIWAGPQPASREAVADWFVNAFPIRHDADRDRIAAAIGQART
ncbi:adenylate/guanylate cyclase domain-containing protein [Pseudodonghicola flavimaris]|uniref:Adenylate/guanylate cyclase domain-containing protein n=1 Tax=Pseudodonghicola flavimaris TaxID=3050036 RepID=A0ABT7F3B7_9RHOB|nr:adenylate/guanylate cyclase domain-containing protein [Pseudodonghicola flavimaris]MDK3019080.1 adenylate/guanylate cyclase domain-containing protein [Pseudodonghicola flavimaris]